MKDLVDQLNHAASHYKAQGLELREALLKVAELVFLIPAGNRDEHHI